MWTSQLLPQRFDLQLAPEEIPHVRSREHRQAGVRLQPLVRGAAAHHLLQCARKGRNVRIPGRWVGGERLPEHRRPGRVIEHRDRLSHSFPQRFALAGVAHARGRDDLGEHDGRREDVRARVRRRALRLFRRHVRGRAGDRVARSGRDRACDSEIHHDDPPGADAHHVLGLDVAVHETCLVDGLEPRQQLRRDDLRLVERQRAPFPQDGR